MRRVPSFILFRSHGSSLVTTALYRVFPQRQSVYGTDKPITPAIAAHNNRLVHRARKARRFKNLDLRFKNENPIHKSHFVNHKSIPRSGMSDCFLEMFHEQLPLPVPCSCVPLIFIKAWTISSSTIIFNPKVQPGRGKKVGP